jgi:hypothetical protein
MGEGCTSCGRKGGCDHRKGVMFAAIDEAMARLYPTRRWGERALAAEAGVDLGLGQQLADRLARRLGAVAVYLPGGPEEYCDYIYVLCLGRAPCLVELRERGAGARAGLADTGEVEGAAIEELYLRVCLSAVAPFAAVQQLALRGTRAGDTLLIEEHLRAGVFDPLLLPRFRSLVATLAELAVTHLDFGEIAEVPAGFDPGDYGERYGGAPALANYLFYPQPCASITTTLVPLPPARDEIVS